jgi:cell division septation protein DedD
MTVVDGFGGQFPRANPAPSKAPAAPAKQPAATAQKPIVVNPPGSTQKPVVIARTTPTTKPVNPAPPVAKAPAASAPKSPAPPPAATGGNGYVAVLASVPVSSKSRLAALQRFADMQQKYSGVLQNKTPSIREANLGARGTYHRLLVGPPGSRAQASALCSQLKSAGHKDCWVTAY